MARRRAASPQVKLEARKDGAQTVSKATATIVVNLDTVHDGAQKVKVEEEAK